MSREKKCTKTTSISAQTVTFAFTNGHTHIVRLGDLSPEIVTQLALHGLSQKGGDAFSQAATVAEAEAAFLQTIDALMGGEWSQRGGGVSLLAEAIAEVQKVDLATVVEKLRELDDGEKRKLAKVPVIAEKMLEIKKAKLPKGDGKGKEALEALFAPTAPKQAKQA